MCGTRDGIMNNVYRDKSTTKHPLLLLVVLACILTPQMPGMTGRTLRVPPAIVLELERNAEGSQYIELNMEFTEMDYFNEGGKLLLVPMSVMKIPGESRGWPHGSGSMVREYIIPMN